MVSISDIFQNILTCFSPYLPFISGTTSRQFSSEISEQLSAFKRRYQDKQRLLYAWLQSKSSRENVQTDRLNRLTAINFNNNGVFWNSEIKIRTSSDSVSARFPTRWRDKRRSIGRFRVLCVCCLDWPQQIASLKKWLLCGSLYFRSNESQEIDFPAVAQSLPFFYPSFLSVLRAQEVAVVVFSCCWWSWFIYGLVGSLGNTPP